jgi:uncharacterized membrane protein
MRDNFLRKLIFFGLFLAKLYSYILKKLSAHMKVAFYISGGGISKLALGTQVHSVRTMLKKGRLFIC